MHYVIFKKLTQDWLFLWHRITCFLWIMVVVAHVKSSIFPQRKSINQFLASSFLDGVLESSPNEEFKQGDLLRPFVG